MKKSSEASASAEIDEPSGFAEWIEFHLAWLGEGPRLVEHWPRLDVRTLARHGGLRSGASVRWEDGGDARVIVTGEDAIGVIYRLRPRKPSRAAVS